MDAADNNEVGELTKIILIWNKGDAAALDDLMQIAINNLRAIAKNHLRKVGNPQQFQTMQPTEIVSEAYLKLRKISHSDVQMSEQFYALCAEIIKNIVIDYARRKSAKQRGGAAVKISLDDTLNLSWIKDGNNVKIEDVFLFQEVLKKLEVKYSREKQIVSLKYYVGLTDEEIGQNLNISVPTVRRALTFAKAWIRREIDKKTSEVFEEATLLKDAAERQEFLVNACEKDSSLLKDVAILLKKAQPNIN